MPPADARLLEVIATSVEDAIAAAWGGADRLEVVSATEADGLSPDVDLVRRLRQAVPLPLRVMLRLRAGFSADAHDLAALCRQAAALRDAGADAFVFGFLTAGGHLDLPALRTLSGALAGAPWTMHRAFDHLDPALACDAFDACADLPGLDGILSAGSSDGIEPGLDTLCDRAAWQTPTLRWIAGGGLQPHHVPTLLAAGITRFHTGRAVRAPAQWHAPINPTLVSHLKHSITHSASRRAP